LQVFLRVAEEHGRKADLAAMNGAWTYARFTRHTTCDMHAQKNGEQYCSHVLQGWLHCWTR